MTRRQLGWIFLLALVARSVVLAQLWGAPFMELLLGDARAYDEWSDRIASGEWWGEETFYQAPLYPYVLGALKSLGLDLLGVRLFQILLASVGCVLIALATARLFDRGTGLAAGVLAALYAPAIWVDGMIQKTSLAMVLSSLLVWLFVRAAQRGDADDAAGGEASPQDSGVPAGRAFAIGIVLGLLTLVRENSSLLLLPLVVWLLAVRPRRRAILPVGLGLALVLLPVGVRNLSIGGSFLPTASNAGVNFYLGNRSTADGLYTPLIPGRGHPAYEEEDARRLAEAAEGRELTAAGVSAHWLGRGLTDIGEDPGRWALLLGWKAQLLMHRNEPMDAESFESHRQVSSALNLLGIAWHAGLLLPLAALGWVLTRGRPGLGLLRAAAPVLGAGLLLFFVVGRFRLGLVPFVLPFAAHGLMTSVRAVRRGSLEPGLGPALLLAVALALIGNLPLDRWPLDRWPFELIGDPIATTDANLASEAMRRGEVERSLRLAERSLARDPTSAAAQFNLAVAARALGDLERARAAFTESLRLEPAYGADVLANLGTLDAMEGDLAGALQKLERACRMDPANASSHYDRGLVLSRLGRRPEAEAAYRTAIERAPDFVDAHHNLGFVLEAQGDWRGALESYRAALALDPEFRLTHQALDRLLPKYPEARDPRRNPSGTVPE